MYYEKVYEDIMLFSHPNNKQLRINPSCGVQLSLYGQ